MHVGVQFQIIIYIDDCLQLDYTMKVLLRKSGVPSPVFVLASNSLHDHVSSRNPCGIVLHKCDFV